MLQSRGCKADKSPGGGLVALGPNPAVALSLNLVYGVYTHYMNIVYYVCVNISGA